MKRLINHEEMNSKEAKLVVYYGNVEVHANSEDTSSIWYS